MENALEMDTSHLDPHEMKLIKAIVAMAEEGGRFALYEQILMKVFDDEQYLPAMLRKVVQLTKHHLARSTVTPTAKAFSAKTDTVPDLLRCRRAS